MDVIENLDAWREKFQSGWLAHYQENGETNWKLYERPRNKEAPAGKSIDLAQSRLILISSAGGYVEGEQERFDAENDIGDYSIRVFPTATPFSDLAYAHTHYDHAAVDADPQVLLPSRHLEDLVAEGIIGELADNVISYSGYQPDVERTLTETIPQILDVVDKEGAHAALLVPA